MKAALLVLDLINDLVHEEGSVGKDGFYAEACKRQVVANTARAIGHCRSVGIPVIYVVVGFSSGYQEWSERSKLFQHVKNKQQVVLGTWATQVHDDLQPRNGEVAIVKNRIDPFYNTSLETVLRAQGIETLYLAGVSTEFVILSTAMSGHDRGYYINVLSECVSSSSAHSHECAMTVIEKVAEITSLENLKKERSLV
jgi:nicotinamidase-related amidase